jgi:hypothetical protein
MPERPLNPAVSHLGEKPSAIAKTSHVAGMGLAAGASMIPVAGGPVSYALEKALDVPLERYNQRVKSGIIESISDAFDRLDGIDENVLRSDEFIAAFVRTSRYSQETASEDKRQLLRNALVNGYVALEGAGERDLFMALISKYDAIHVDVLRRVAELSANSDETLAGVASHVQRLIPNSETLAIQERVVDLVSDGLVSRQDLQETRSARVGNAWEMPRTEQQTRTSTRHYIAQRGLRFLDFVRAPGSVKVAGHEQST